MILTMLLKIVYISIGGDAVLCILYILIATSGSSRCESAQGGVYINASRLEESKTLNKWKDATGVAMVSGCHRF